MVKNEGKLEGKLEERNEKNRAFISNLLMQTDFENEKIAALADV
jgi:hypothetical protein